MSAMPTVLVTGGAGYIGSHVVYALIDAGYRPVVLDNLSTGSRDLVAKDAEFIVGDAGDRALVGGLLSERGCRAVMHFAGSIVVPESVEKPLDYYANNVENSLHLLQACQAAGTEAFIFSSTAAVYASQAERPIREDDPTAPANPYGRSKLMTETMLRDLSAIGGPRHGILRYFNVAGADPQLRTGQCSPEATHLLKRACMAALGRISHVDVFGDDYPTADGTGVRDYIHVTDLAAAPVSLLAYLLTDGESCTLNCGYGHGFSVNQVLDAVDRAVGTPVARRTGPRRAGDAASLVADSTRLRRLLDWRPRYDDLDRIVETALDWERQLPAAD